MASLISYLISVVVKPKQIIRKNKHNIPLPAICHEVIPPSVLGDRAVFVIGDVHGCLEEMCELIDKASAEEDNPLFVFVGDLVNKGPNSVGVIRKLREMGHNAHAVRGNHDEGALREIFSYTDQLEYELPARYSWIKELSNEDIEYLNSLPYTISIPSLKALVVHGGVVPGKPLELQKLNDLTNMRNVVEKGDPFESEGLIGCNKTKSGIAWIQAWPGPEHVYFGHDAQRKLQRGCYATGLDTGCVYGGKLTGVFVNGCRKFLSVRSKQPVMYDNE